MSATPAMSEARTLVELDAQVLMLDVLRRLFIQGPGQGLVNALHAVQPVADELPAQVAQALRRMLECAQTATAEATAASDLEVEYTRLTIGPIQIPAVPYASYHLSPSKSLMTDETMAVRRHYLEAGVALRELGRTPDDHLGVEIEFMHFLTRAALEAEWRGDASARSAALGRRAAFVDEHAAKWFPLFADALAAASSLTFFKDAAVLLRQSVQLSEATNRG